MTKQRVIDKGLDREGTLVAQGPEVSQVKTDDGKTFFTANEHLDGLMLPDELNLNINPRKPLTPEGRAKVDKIMSEATQQQKQMAPESAALLAEIEAAKKQKARGRISGMLAKKNGLTKAMPLEGKAALARIAHKASEMAKEPIKRPEASLIIAPAPKIPHGVQRVRLQQ